MERYIKRENIRLFRERLLDPDLTPEQRATVERLLEEEIASLPPDEEGEP